MTATSDTGIAAPSNLAHQLGACEITPFMALAVALIYMLTADGAIDDHESSQLQAVVGSHSELLDMAFAYAEENAVEQFLKDTDGILNQDDHWCILTNLCDCLLSDGLVDDHELKLFRQISDAFSITDVGFTTHFNLLKLKNNKSVLGKFSPQSLTLTGESAHLTLACSLLYMMAADGNIAEEEIGQLQVVLGEFEGLQAVAMQTVRTVKMNVFLRQAAPLLTQDQKIMILSNVCDSMMSDGKINVIEDNLFQNMLAAFSVPMSGFKPFYETIKIKCIKPFDTESIPTAFHSRVTLKQKNDQSGLFKIRHQKKSADDAEATGYSSDQPEGDWVSEVDEKQLSAVVHRTMQDNIKQANESFSGRSDVENVQSNAVNSPASDFSKSSEKNENLQKVQEVSVKDNIQKANSSHFESNLQSVVDAAATSNIQSVTDKAIKSHSQKVADAVSTANIQSVTDDAIKSNSQKAVDTALAANIQSIPVDSLSDSKVADKDPAVRPSSSDSSADKLPNHELLGSTLIQVPALKMVDPKAVQDLQSQIDKVHLNLDKLSPAKTPKAPVSAFASLVLETRLPANNQLKQKPASSLPQATQVASLPIFEKNLQPLADEPLHSGNPVHDKTASSQNKAYENKSARPSKEAVESVTPLAFQTPATDKAESFNVDTTMLSNLTRAVHYNDVWGTFEIDWNEQALDPSENQNKREASVLPISSVSPVSSDMLTASAESSTHEPSPVVSDGSVDWRVLLLLLAFFSMPAVILGQDFLYPSQTCHGVGQLERKWALQGSDNPSTVVHEESVSLTHSIRFSASQIWVDGQRFPLYKELNQTSHFAETTPKGVKGSFNTQGIAKIRYAFAYEQATQELRIDMQSSGLGTEEGQVGWVEENISFTGRCSSHGF
jgi:uncharacterized tellurite resistance protein B-like protein